MTLFGEKYGEQHAGGRGPEVGAGCAAAPTCGRPPRSGRSWSRERPAAAGDPPDRGRHGRRRPGPPARARRARRRRSGACLGARGRGQARRADGTTGRRQRRHGRLDRGRVGGGGRPHRRGRRGRRRRRPAARHVRPHPGQLSPAAVVLGGDSGGKARLVASFDSGARSAVSRGSTWSGRSLRWWTAAAETTRRWRGPADRTPRSSTRPCAPPGRDPGRLRS